MRAPRWATPIIESRVTSAASSSSVSPRCRAGGEGSRGSGYPRWSRARAARPRRRARPRTPRALHAVGDGPRAVGQALVPVRRRPEQRARIAGAERADDHVVHVFCVLDRTTTGDSPGSRPSSSAAARASASRRCLNSGSTQARATTRAPSAGVRETSASILARTSSRRIAPFSKRSSSSARTRAAAAGSSPFVIGAWSWSCSCSLIPLTPASARRCRRTRGNRRG